MRRPRSASPRARRLAACVLGLALGLVVAETLARWITAQRIDHFDPARVDLGWTNEEYDSFDPCADDPRDPRARVLVLGDSYMQPGYDVGALDGRLHRRLEVLLPVRTQALAVGGWGTDQQLFAFLQKGAAWKPDLVVLAFCSNNDLLNNASSRQGKDAWKPYFQLRGGSLLAYDVDGKPLAYADPHPTRASALLDFAVQAVSGGRQRGLRHDRLDAKYSWDGRQAVRDFAALSLPARLEYSPHTIHDLTNAYSVEPYEWIEYQWALFERVLAKLDGEVRATGARFVLLMLPMSLDPKNPRLLTGSGLVHRFETPDGPLTLDLAVPQRRVAEICARLGIELWDPIDAFHAAAIGSKYEQFFPDPLNRHWSVHAHRFLGHWIAERLRPRIEFERVEGRGRRVRIGPASTDESYARWSGVMEAAVGSSGGAPSRSQSRGTR